MWLYRFSIVLSFSLSFVVCLFRSDRKKKSVVGIPVFYLTDFGEMPTDDREIRLINDRLLRFLFFPPVCPLYYSRSRDNISWIKYVHNIVYQLWASKNFFVCSEYSFRRMLILQCDSECLVKILFVHYSIIIMWFYNKNNHLFLFL
jgi:hypothetical protein